MDKSKASAREEDETNLCPHKKGMLEQREMQSFLFQLQQQVHHTFIFEPEGNIGGKSGISNNTVHLVVYLRDVQEDFWNTPG